MEKTLLPYNNNEAVEYVLSLAYVSGYSKSQQLYNHLNGKNGHKDNIYGLQCNGQTFRLQRKL